MRDKYYGMVIFVLSAIFEDTHFVDIVIFTHLPRTPEAIAAIIFLCICWSEIVLPGTAPAHVFQLTTVVMGAISRSHVKIDVNIEK